ncbi:MAG TPA: hypothetical protein EYH32_01295 [Anaerolineae bacterium]|nr:hypothetical protein [Anaerolineae bacterium]
MQLTFLTLDDLTQELNNQGVSAVRVDALERIQSRGETPPRRIGEIVATARLDENTVAAAIFRILDEPAGPQTPTDLVRCGDNARQAIELLGEYFRDRGLEVRPGFWEFECPATANCDLWSFDDAGHLVSPVVEENGPGTGEMWN